MAWYNTGTIALTNGSATVTGSGTNFLVGAQIGEALYAPDGKLYEIQTINSATVITLASNYLGSTASAQGYQIIPTQSLVADLASDVTDLISDFADVRDYAGNGKFNDGAVGTPGITFTQDQDNGLYRIGSNNWALAAGGQQVVNLTTTAMNFPDNNKAIFGAGSDLQIYSDGTTGQVTGNVNVTGTVTADGLTVDGALSSGGITTTGNTAAGTASAGDGRLFPNNTYGAFVYGNGTTYDVALGQRSTGVALGVPAGTANVVIPSGNVGIGISSPDSVLEVNLTTSGSGANNNTAGSSIGVGSSSTTQPILGMRWTGASHVGISGSAFSTQIVNDTANSNAFEMYTTGATPLVFGTAATERMRIDSGGSVLIGKTTPADLHNTWNHIIIGEKGAIISENGAGGIDGIILADNAYIDADTGTYAYQTTAAASQITQSGGAITFSNAASGSAGAALTPVPRMTLDASGRVTMPYQPAFLVVAATQNNIPINANTTVNFTSEVFDQGSNYAGTSFTAPVTGKYQLNLSLYVLAIDSDAEYVQVAIVTSNRSYYAIVDPGVWTGDPTYWSFAITVLADMDASDTARVEVQLNNTGAAQMDITANSAFSGYLVA